MFSMTVDLETDMAYVDLKLDIPIVRTVEVGRSLLANYDVDGDLVGVEILSLAALGRPDVVADLTRLLDDRPVSD